MSDRKAKRVPDWADKAAQRIWMDCLDRAGIKFELRRIEQADEREAGTYEPIKPEILAAWAKIIRRAGKAQS